MAKSKISISFTENRLHLYNYIKTKDNVSSYICGLIEDDLNKNKNDIPLEKKVEEILNKLLADKHISINNEDDGTIEAMDKITEEDVDLILKLF